MLNLYQFPTGRRLFCLLNVREVLESAGIDDLRAEVERAIAADRATRELEDHYRGSKVEPEHAPEAAELDAELSRSLSALDGVLAATLKAFGGKSPPGVSAVFARSRLFPHGVRHMRRMSFVEREVAVETLLLRAQTERRLAQEIRRLGVQSFVERVAEVNVRYRRALQVTDATKPSYAEVLAARKAGQEALSGIVVSLMARLRGADKGKESRALALALQQVIDQNAAIKRHRRRRRHVTDVDPETGDEVADDGGGGDGEDFDEADGDDGGGEDFGAAEEDEEDGQPREEADAA
ncbi:MAG: hypothetical protein KDD82_26690 [Planctomycetes bacterium]|nr:hypothetical protein [Planctomycetota bacterium]